MTKRSGILSLSLSFVFYIVIVLGLYTYGSVGSEVFDSYPLFKFNRAGEESVSRKTSLNFVGTSYHTAYDESGSRSKAILLPYTEFIKRSEAFLRGDYPDLTNNVIGEYQKTIAGGSSALIIVLPSEIPSEMQSKWQEAERELMTNPLLIPVHFIFENNELNAILATIEAATGDEAISLPDKIYNLILGDNFQFTVSTSEPSILKKVSGTNIQGWLAGSGGDSANPTVAIFANYDSLAASSTLSKSAKGTTSSSVILLELARLYHKLYSQSRSQTNYNILFVLTSGGQFNFQGSKEWLNQVDGRILKSLEVVLCLDSLGEVSDSLYLHTSRPDKDPIAQRLYQSFADAASALDMNISIKQKKVNVSIAEEPWEHEQFSKKRILASTLSTRSNPLPNLGRSHMFDDVYEKMEETLNMNTRLVAEALARHMFRIESKDLLVFQMSTSVDKKLQGAWMEALLKVPRTLPYISESLVDGLEQILSTYTNDVSRNEFTMDKTSPFVFFSQEERTDMTVSVAKPFLFDIVLAISIGTFLFALYGAIKFLKIFDINKTK